MTLIWAHRGASAIAPENTLPAFELARDRGADGVELDVQLTADGQVVVCHDELVDRTSNGTGVLGDMTLEELKSLDFGSWMPGYEGTQIPTLAEVYELLAPTGMTVNVELKNSVQPYPGLEAAVDALTAQYGMGDRVWYSSFNHISMRDLAAVSSVPCALLHADVLIDWWDYATKAGAAALHPHWSTPLVQPDYIARAHDAGLRVHAWTVDDPRFAERLIALGVDALIKNEV